MNARALDGATQVTGPVVDVAFTPAELRRTDVAVVVDVLRATSTIVAALASGYDRVICCASVEQAKELRGPRRHLAGERDCLPIPGFDRGNSPRALAADEAEELVLCTTNGSAAIVHASRAARRVFVASLLNLETVIAAIPPRCDVTVVCAGTQRRPALEDTYVAGRIVDQLPGSWTDAARTAAWVAAGYGTAERALADSANGRTLRATGQAEDIDFCARESLLSVVPRAVRGHHGVAFVGDTAGPLRRRDSARRTTGVAFQGPPVQAPAWVTR